MKTKITIIVKKNKGFKTLLKVRKIINEECEEETVNINITLTLGKIASFKYIPLASYDVGRIFNRYKYILRCIGRSF